MIKGLSDRRRLVRGGKLRIGVRDKDRGYPKAVDYWIFDPVDKNLIPKFRDRFGARPKSLPILFPHSSLSVCFPQSLEAWKKGGLFCKGDGERAVRFDPSTRKPTHIDCPHGECSTYRKNECKETARLIFMLQEFEGLLCWEWDTSSKNSILNINSTWDLVRQATGGRVALIPFHLVLAPHETTVPGQGGNPAFRKVVYVAQIQCQIPQNDLLAMRAKALQVSTGGLKYLLPPVGMDQPEDLWPSEELTGAGEPRSARMPMRETEAEVIGDEQPTAPKQPGPRPSIADLIAASPYSREITRAVQVLGLTREDLRQRWEKARRHPERLSRILEDELRGSGLARARGEDQEPNGHAEDPAEASAWIDEQGSLL